MQEDQDHQDQRGLTVFRVGPDLQGLAVLQALQEWEDLMGLQGPLVFRDPKGRQEQQDLQALEDHRVLEVL